MLQMNFGGSGVVVKGEAVCVRCVSRRVYGVSHCLGCLHQVGTSLLTTVLCYPDGGSRHVENLRLVIAEVAKYGLEVPERWYEAAGTRVFLGHDRKYVRKSRAGLARKAIPTGGCRKRSRQRFPVDAG